MYFFSEDYPEYNQRCAVMRNSFVFWLEQPLSWELV